MAEWSKANDSKSFNSFTIRGFESHPLRVIYETKDAIGCQKAKIPSDILKVRISKANLVSLNATRCFFKNHLYQPSSN